MEVSKIILLVRTVNQKQSHIAGRTAEIRVTLKDLEVCKVVPVRSPFSPPQTANEAGLWTAIHAIALTADIISDTVSLLE